MLSVKGGANGKGKRRYGVSQVRPPSKKNTTDQVQDKEGPTDIDKKKETKRQDQILELPRRIQVKRQPYLEQVPGNTWMCSPFIWDPQAFALESERLDSSKIIDPKAQDDSLLAWMDNPTAPVIYGVCGNPNEVKARLFAAYLLSLHCRHLGSKANPVWHVLYGGYENKLLKEYSSIDSQYEPSILVLSNLAPNSTGQKFEKAKDLLERFSSIPRIVIAAGEDPISFLSTRLYVECNALAYFSESLVKKKVEVI